MRLLADSALPALIAEPNSSSAEIVRFAGGAMRDIDVLSFASLNGFVGVILLGRQSEADADLLASARDLGVSLILTISEVPTEAAYHVLARIEDIAALLPTSEPIVVGKNGPRPKDSP
jgi:predicted nuclease of predicted toxin-antitoxin system